MKRRKFIHTLGAGLSAPIFLNGVNLSVMPRSGLSRFINPNNDRVLVLIQLLGGNDGLNTIIPLDQYEGLSAVRPNILIPEKEVLPMDDKVGLHPSLPGLQSLYSEGKMSVIQSVGYPDQNRSHFRSTDIWTSGSPADQVWSSGWLGRYFEEAHPTFPDGYPNESSPDPFAITMGSIVTETCQGMAGNFSLALVDPYALIELEEPDQNSTPNDDPYYDELNFIKQTIVQTNAYSQTVFAAAKKGKNRVEYPETALAQKFKNIATLISGGLDTKVYLVSLGGFDTHANQVVGSDVLSGEHANLLTILSDAIAAFQQDLKLLRLEEKVLGLTFSEFGRRIRSNDSFGTDHGTAAPLMLFGSCVNSRIFGENPEIDKEVDKVAGVPMQYDFRDLYGSVLNDWFEVPETAIKNILQYDYQHIPLIESCSAVTSTEFFSGDPAESIAFPNPFRNQLTIDYKATGEHVNLTIFDAIGNRLAVLVNDRIPAGRQSISWSGESLPSGSYFYRLQVGRQVSTRMVIKL